MAKIKEGKENISKLEETLLRLNREYGAGTILCGNTIQMEFDIVDTGSIALNAAIGIGGAPRGRIMEIVGPESSGKTTLLLELIANAQKAGIKCAMIDMEHHLSGAYAQSLGVNLDELILSQPLYGESAMKIAEELIKTKEVGLVAVDSVAALVPKSEVESGVGDPKMAGIARIMSQALRVINPLVEVNNVLLIFTNQIRSNPGGMVAEEPTGGKALRFYAGVRLDMRRIKNDRNEEMSRTKIKVLKNKVGKPFSEIEIDLIWGEGFGKMGEIVDIAEELGIIVLSGSWYKNPGKDGTSIAQGRNAMIQLLKDNPEMAATWKAEIISKLTPVKGE